MGSLSQGPTRAAVIDLGSMAVRLHIAEGFEKESSAPFRSLHVDRRISRLAENLGPGEELSPAAMEKTLDLLHEFQSDIRRFQVAPPWVRIVCTEALRKAVNGTAFAGRIEAETGFHTVILSADEEARWTALGVLLAAPPSPGPVLIVDPGGGSTEFIWVRDAGSMDDRVELRCASEPMGVLELTHRFALGAPADPEALLQLETHIQTRLTAVLGRVLNTRSQVSSLLVTGGTALNLAAIHRQVMPKKEAHALFQTTVSREALEILYRRLASSSIDERAGETFLEPGREDVIVPGLAILRALLAALGASSVTLTHSSLREGILGDLLKGTAMV